MRVRVLGPLEVWNNGHWRGPGTPKQRAILAILLTANGDTVSLDHLIDTIWPEAPPRTAVNLIQGHIVRLRRALGDHVGNLLSIRSSGYRLILAPDDLDSTLFELQVREGTAA